jgi:hypothetical protein
MVEVLGATVLVAAGWEIVAEVEPQQLMEGGERMLVEEGALAAVGVTMPLSMLMVRSRWKKKNLQTLGLVRLNDQIWRLKTDTSQTYL